VSVTPQSIATHEAGHGVVGCALGTPPEWMAMGAVTLANAAAETKFPMLVHFDEPARNTEASLLAALAIDVAGLLAEVKFLRDLGEAFDIAEISHRSRSDLSRAFYKFTLLPEMLGDYAATMARVIKTVIEILYANWPRVEALAAALLAHGKLNQSQIEAIYAR
jgi:hypothetical protein